MSLWLRRWTGLTVVDPDDDALPVVSVATIEATSTNLVLGKIPGIHNSKAPVVPGGASVGLTVCRGVAAAAGAARILKPSANLASRTHSRVGLASMSDVEIRLVTTDCIAFSAAANAIWDVLDTVMRDNIKVGVGPFGQEGADIGERCCDSPCGK